MRRASAAFGNVGLCDVLLGANHAMTRRMHALENGTLLTELNFEIADTTIGIARAEAFCSGVRFPGPRLDSLETKLRHYLV